MFILRIIVSINKICYILSKEMLFKSNYFSLRIIIATGIKKINIKDIVYFQKYKNFALCGLLWNTL